ncbi:conserved Plasmodium protein, unknown function [Plasmodium berghei]|uniref:Uncharacterized protein n=2 Tax=Plasmodium berghei TaxID=5821 RepID=A0A509AGN4_PLABA|nr:conserved protein, unknown function [Plasmodium berghei ANKA]CXI05018.1 conserved Plasmodium protein, unknown function [Plasmodium berghei]SCL92343.1 conserved Plasmodium protein, unknown function [Plasmodium berghei]SCM15644.1 conserved Plasmodium protein, unknown function [Plasmodium berghei]SCM17436.1 conserved Plasmodium protein, unknown function [Plasmodium berghei]SCN22743.1 conserved Plasmodium protein, unknown function [Plasmodium berghei]|eukprot:XP_034420241.1 conserved protein, unknown function [Plasmodium berghei ANKA]
MNYVSEAKKYFSIFQLNHILCRQCRVNNIKEHCYNKFHFTTKNGDYNNNSLNTKSTNETKNNNNYDFSKPKYKIINSQPKRNLSVFGYNRGRFFVSIKKDFTSFVVNSLIIFVFLYSVYTLAPKETVSQRRKRIITERLMKEYNISDKDLEMIEHYDDVTGR